ncbi:hypothetical protein [Nocardia sp. SSK8]
MISRRPICAASAAVADTLACQPARPRGLAGQGGQRGGDVERR